MQATRTVAFPRVEVAERLTVAFAVDPDSDDPIGRWLLHSPVLDEPPLRLVLDLLERSGGRFVDVGAHIGSFSIAAAAMGISVVSLEASPENARLLRLAAAENDLSRLRVINAVAAARSGRAAFVPNGPWGHRPRRTTAEAIEMPAVAIDDVVERLRWDHVDVVKLDIEGSEPEALAGMTYLLDGTVPPILVMEVNAEALTNRGHSRRGLLSTLSDHGFELFYIDRSRVGRLVRVATDDVQTECVADYLATRSGQMPPKPWWVDESLSTDEVVSRLVVAAADGHAGYRRYVAEVVADGPPWLRMHPEVCAALRALALDPDPGVRAAASTAGATMDEWHQRTVRKSSR